MVLITDNQPSKILKPGEKAFHFPSPFIAAKFASILGLWFFSAFSVGRYHFNVALNHELLVQGIAVIGFIAYDSVRRIMGEAGVYGVLNQLHFMGRRTFNMYGDRKTRSVCDCHDLGAFATLCLADSKTPFFAGAKLPSMKASRMSILPRSCRSSASSWTMRWKTPWRTHCWNRRWHVWYGGYRAGMSFQGAPVRMIHRIPLSISRGSRGGLPRGSLGGVNSMITGSNRFHCSFVSSILIVCHNQIGMSRFILR